MVGPRTSKLIVGPVQLGNQLVGSYYIYIISSPNLGFEIAIPGREREQGRFRGSTEGARGRSEGASREHKGGGALREQQTSKRRRSKKGEALAPRMPNLVALHSALLQSFIQQCACCYLKSFFDESLPLGSQQIVPASETKSHSCMLSRQIFDDKN